MEHSAEPTREIAHHAAPSSSSYEERVYAGVLGKLIGVYLGRPFEGWTYERIRAELGEIDGFVQERFGLPLILTDDDLAGTFTFVRALADHGYDCALTPAQIGQTWLNYIVPGRTVLWWGGVGRSTEHTAYDRLRAGIVPPASGSAVTNGEVLSQQIGAQIFIDGWAMVAPGDPALAADLARRAASVSHDGAAIHAAQVVAALGAEAFVEDDLNRLLDVATGFIPRDGEIFRLIADLRDWHTRDGDWRVTRRRLADRYGYERCGGDCPVVPNHGLIILALLYGAGDFRESLRIVTSCGWDTDCNAGNLGCLLGIRGGLPAIDAGWRAQVADRLYLSTADGGRAITDAPTEAIRLVNTYRALHHRPPLAPKDGARFHFELPGAVHGFRLDEGDGVTLENVVGHSERGTRSLALRWDHPRHATIRLVTPTFIPPEARDLPSYELLACPTLYPGQELTCRVSADASNPAGITGRLFLQVYDGQDSLTPMYGASVFVAPAEAATLAWTVPTTGGQPIAAVGLEVSPHGAGALYLDYLIWSGAPRTTLTRPEEGGVMWRRAWVDAVDSFETDGPAALRISHENGDGLLSQGAADWQDYVVEARVTPHLCRRAGIAARVQGLHRYHALLLAEDGTIRLLRARHQETVLAARPFPWTPETAYTLRLALAGANLRAWVDGALLFDLTDPVGAADGGGVALLCTAGSLSCDGVRIEPLSAP